MKKPKPYPKNRRTYTIEDAREIFASSGLELLNNEYLGVNPVHEVKCFKCDHVFKTSIRHIKKGGQCPVCSGAVKTIQFARDVARQKGFELISTEYVSVKAKYLWKCQDGHEFEKTLADMRSRGRCSKCSFFITEEKCRFVLESATGYEFIKSRKIVAPLELDGYCSELKLAFEYNGPQHYHDKTIGLTSEPCSKIKHRDELKKKKCQNLGIRLIIVPYTEKDISRFIYEQLDRLEIEHSKELDWNNFKNYQAFRLKNLLSKLDAAGITTTCRTYLGGEEPIQLYCTKCEHSWTNCAGVLLRGVGCPRCRLGSMTLSEVKEFCGNKGLIFRDANYVNSSHKHNFECIKCKHQWATLMSTLKRGCGCPKCASEKYKKEASYYVMKSQLARQAAYLADPSAQRPKTLRYTLPEIHRICTERGWKFLDDDYQNSYKKYKFICLTCNKVSLLTFKWVLVGAKCKICSSAPLS